LKKFKATAINYVRVSFFLSQNLDEIYFQEANLLMAVVILIV